MLKYCYKVLKYISKHQPISKTELLKKFPDFESCLPEIYKHLDIEDENHLIEQAEEQKVATEADKVCKTVSERSEYISRHRKEYDYDNSIIFYSVKTSFKEILEQKQAEVKKSLFKTSTSFLKFVITYILGIVSGLIIAYLTHKFGWD